MRIKELCRGLSVLLWGCVVLLLTGSAQAANFGYRKSITLAKAKVGVSGTSAMTISDFPVLVSFTDADLKVTTSGGHVTSSSGYDIVFRGLDTTTCNGPASCTLSHELVTYTSTTGKISAWVRIPKLKTISNSAATVIYMYYGNSSITTSTARKTDVWTNFASVWHLDEAAVNGPSTSTFYDSSSNGRDATSTTLSTTTTVTTSSTPSARIDKALNFDHTDDRLTSSNFLSGATALVAEAWINSTEDFGAVPTRIVAKTDTDDETSTNFVFALSYRNHLGTYEGWVTDFGTNGTAPTRQQCSGSSPQNNGRQYIVARWDGSTVKIYQNGTLQATEAGCNYAKTGTLNTTTTPVTIGAATTVDTSLAFYVIDEVRLSTVDRDADYIKTAYNTANSPSTFLTPIGTEEAAPAFAVDFLGGRALKLPNGQVLLGWETGLERDNLGFQVVREQGGVFSQLTKDLVEGSLLRAMVGGNGNSPYFWLDPTGWGAGPVRYFVDDVDAHGVTTRHGPFAPSAPSGSTDESLMSVWTARQQPEPVLASQPMSLATGPVSTLEAGADFAPIARAMEVAPASGPPLIKLGVLKAGWQRVTGADLNAQGFPLGIPSNQVALSKDGADISRVITDGGDGTFDADDTLEFWGLGEPGIYANESVYAVSWEGALGRNVQHSGQAPPAMSALGPSGFSTFTEYAEKKFYLAALNNGPADNFLGPVIRPSGLTVPMPTPDALNASDARLMVNLQGTSLLPHQVEVAWNGLPLGSVDFANREAATFESALSELYADNTLTLTGKAGMYDYSAIANARVFYQRAYKAQDEQLRFTALGGDRVTLSAFTQPGIRVLDITNPNAPLELSVLEFGSAGALSGKVTIPGSGTRELFAFTPSAAFAPSYLKRYQSSSLKSAGPADLVIFSHAAFIDRLAPLVAQRERDGLRVVVDDVDAIYDDFGRGRKDPEAIREAMRWLKAQGKPAQYLLLVGDGTFDPHNYLGKNVVDFLPVPTINTPAFETAYDDFYGDLDEDGKPDVAVGRLPMRTPEDLDIAIEKLLRYSAAPPAWPLDVLLVSGEDPQIDVAKIGHDGLEGEQLSVFEQPLISTTPKAELLQSLVEPSSRLVSYIGHGSTQAWGNGSAFATSDAATLSRSGPPSVFTLLTCLNGFFHDVYSESVAEGLLRAPNGAAVSVWAAPAMAQSDDLGVLYRAFITEWTSGRVHTLGELVLAAKRAVPSSDTERMMAILGDPSLKLALPEIAQARSDALAHANDPPPVVTAPEPPPVLPTDPSPTNTPGLPHGTHRLLTAANTRTIATGPPMPHTIAVAPSPITKAAPENAPMVDGQSATGSVPAGPPRNSCAVSSGASTQSSWGGALLLAALCGYRLRRNRRGALGRFTH